ncbi:hypothetical protein [Corynebacterium flavescens]|uniref:hypothetical protein n=1 Tax=Corynebacterium flavescens TaxID=28028 RepID=UPI003FD5B501
MTSKKNNPNLSHEERILLFEWHAKHLESWRETCFPKKYSVNMMEGMSTEHFHAASIAAVLLRKFYSPGHEVLISRALDSLAALLPSSETSLKDNLQSVKHFYKEYLKQSPVVDAPQGFTPDAVVEDVQYGLLIHSDPGRAERLIEMQRGWMHEMLVVQRGHIPVLRTLKTIEDLRNRYPDLLPPPLNPIWEPKEHEGISIEEAERIEKALGF